jgi:hypothetical protein
VSGSDDIGPFNQSGKKRKAFKRDLAVFSFFLVLSFVLWFLNSLSKEIEAGIRYDIKYANIPGDKVITASFPGDLKLFLKGPGYSVLKQKFPIRQNPVVIDISKVSFKRTQGNKGYNYFIITSSLEKSLNVQMRNGCEITSIKPDTLFFSLEKPVALTGKQSDSKQDKSNGRH